MTLCYVNKVSNIIHVQRLKCSKLIPLISLLQENEYSELQNYALDYLKYLTGINQPVSTQVGCIPKNKSLLNNNYIYSYLYLCNRQFYNNKGKNYIHTYMS